MRVEKYIAKALGGFYNTHEGREQVVWVYDEITFLAKPRDVNPPLMHEGKMLQGILNFETGEVGLPGARHKRYRWDWLAVVLRGIAGVFGVVLTFGVMVIVIAMGGKPRGHVGSRHHR